MADAAEGVVAAIAAAGGDDEVVFAAGDWVAKDDFGGDGVAFKDLRLLDDLRFKDGLAHCLLLMVKMSCGDGRNCQHLARNFWAETF